MVSRNVHALYGEARTTLNEADIPKVLFLISAQYLPFVVNKISNIEQLILLSLSIPICFHYCTRHNTYSELLCQLLISVQIFVPLRTEEKELRVFGHPVCKMVFGKDSEVGAI